jgi:hypothetical protein
MSDLKSVIDMLERADLEGLHDEMALIQDAIERNTQMMEDLQAALLDSLFSKKPSDDGDSLLDPFNE